VNTQTPGIDAAKEFIDAFNAQDHERLGRALNYPHIRLALGEFKRIESRNDFVDSSRSNESRLRSEGWNHTKMRSIEVIHQGTDKIHLSITNDRCDAEGKVYNSFDTMWVATLQDGHWGIQFRSSFLR